MSTHKIIIDPEFFWGGATGDDRSACPRIAVEGTFDPGASHGRWEPGWGPSFQRTGRRAELISRDGVPEEVPIDADELADAYLETPGGERYAIDECREQQRWGE